MTDFQTIQSKLSRKTILYLCGLLIVAMLAAGFAWTYKTVQIITDGKHIVVNTLYSDPKSVLAQEHIALESPDEYRMSTDKLDNGTVITVYRAMPVTVMYQGKAQSVITAKPTVGEVAASMGLFADNIRLEPGADTAVVPNLQINATVLSEKIVERQQPDLFTVLRKPDASLERGTEAVEQEGQDGAKTVVIKQHFADGNQVSEEVLSERVNEPSIPKIIRVGTRDTVETSRGAMRFRRSELMEATAYNPWDGSGAGITATGMQARRGIVAVDPRVIPLGSRLFIPGYGMALAADTGGAIVGNRVDLCMDGYGEAISFGRRMVKVYVLE
ncbi:3D domain-containing protein [Propionispora hippei]|uniref:3D (Asp-Asp-Asp) domain-containing protein n=1 Tax=Propionispora hippei DSM 15287 TaxID=1123003 RepID=A0A1M6BLJ1_9FIRM|nr:3D domain-containing protein [Propionispora hippei]SHI49585.1 3D (Asp-Asp-Asp) domain-containing protein [Propionispora hippei DSM 15287]